MKKSLGLAAAAAIAILAGSIYSEGGTTAYAAPVDRMVAEYGPATYADARSAVERDVAEKRTRLRTAQDSWMARELLAKSLIDRFAYSQDIGDLQEAQLLLNSAMDLAPTPSGPNFTRATLAMQTHNLATAAQMLDREDAAEVPATRAERANHLDMRGDIAFQRGDLGGALAHYRSADDLSPGFGTKLRLAQHTLWTGNPAMARETAEKAFAAAKLDPPRFARMALLMANLSYAQGDIARAGEWVEKAAATIEGDWLVDTYVAQQHFAEGRRDLAITQLGDIAGRTGQPDVMDLLAGFLQSEGRDAEARRWIGRASNAWERKLAASPSAYRLHAAEHYLDFGDPERALELARAEVTARPQGEGIEVLASALIANDRPQAALQILDKALSDGWSSVSLHMARAEALQMTGQRRAATGAERDALALSPQAKSSLRKLIRFGHF